MSDADALVESAQRQLEEHREWLSLEIGKLSLGNEHTDLDVLSLAQQAMAVRVRVVSARAGAVAVVYDYPDELYAFLASDRAPPHLRASLAGGQVVSPDQPAVTVEREP